MDLPQNEHDPVLSFSKTVSYSEWRPAPLPDPILIRRIQKIRWGKGLVVVACAMACGGLFWSMMHFHLGAGIGAAFQFLLMYTVAMWRWASSKRASASVADLLDLPVTIPQFPVQVIYNVRSAEYGRDEGLISFIDGWVHFQGHRTSWSLHALEVHHISSPPQSGLAWDSTHGRASQYLMWNLNSAQFNLELIPQDSIEGLGGGLGEKFSEAFRTWDRDQSPKPGPGLYPPAQPMPMMMMRLIANFRCLRVLELITSMVVLGYCWAAWQLDTSFAVHAIISFTVTMILFWGSHRVGTQLQTIVWFCHQPGDEKSVQPRYGPRWIQILDPWV